MIEKSPSYQQLPIDAISEYSLPNIAVSSSFGKNDSSLRKYSCIIANDDHFQMMAVSYNLRALNVIILKEACNGLEVFQFVK